MVELTVLGISLQEEGSAPVLLLHPLGTRRVLSMGIGPMEAFAISTALHSVEPAARSAGKSAIGPELYAAARASFPFPRPLTHDFLASIIPALGGLLVSVDILRVVDGAYIAEAVVRKEGGEVRIDCRPSDGIAVALRCGASIRADGTVLEHSEDMDEVMATLPEHVRTIAAAKLSGLAPAGVERRRSGIPAAIEKALGLNRDTASNGELISVARRMIEEEENRGAEEREIDSLLEEVEKRAVRRIRVDAPLPSPSGEKADEGPVIKVTGGVIRAPQIRVSLVRQQREEPPPALPGALKTPAEEMSDEALAALGLTRREAEAVLGAPDNDRWAMLLRLLAPETKVPM